jgi:hypothetical protein
VRNGNWKLKLLRVQIRTFAPMSFRENIPPRVMFYRPWENDLETASTNFNE